MIKAKKAVKKTATKKSVKKTAKKATTAKKAAPKKTATKKTTTKKTVAKKAVASSPVKKAPEKAVAPKVVTKTVAQVTPAAAKSPSVEALKKKGQKVVSSNINGVGRRKSSVARVWLSRGTGSMVVNGQDVNIYFNTDQNRSDAVKALSVCDATKIYTIKVNVKGGGPCSQAGAVRLGVARALLKHNEDFKSTLKEHGLLTVDSRLKERKKPGQKAARRKFQFVKR